MYIHVHLSAYAHLQTKLKCAAINEVKRQKDKCLLCCCFAAAAALSYGPRSCRTAPWSFRW